MTDTMKTTDRLFRQSLPQVLNVFVASEAGASENETQTNDVFSEKWTTLEQDAGDQDEAWKQLQFQWYLRCYGFDSEQEFSAFLKNKTVLLDAGCGFWNEEFGYEASKSANFDWYAPSTAFRYTMPEFETMIGDAGFRSEFLHSEEACHTGRFTK